MPNRVEQVKAYGHPGRWKFDFERRLYVNEFGETMTPVEFAYHVEHAAKVVHGPLNKAARLVGAKPEYQPDWEQLAKIDESQIPLTPEEREQIQIEKATQAGLEFTQGMMGGAAAPGVVLSGGKTAFALAGARRVKKAADAAGKTGSTTSIPVAEVLPAQPFRVTPRAAASNVAPPQSAGALPAPKVRIGNLPDAPVGPIEMPGSSYGPSTGSPVASLQATRTGPRGNANPIGTQGPFYSPSPNEVPFDRPFVPGTSNVPVGQLRPPLSFTPTSSASNAGMSFAQKMAATAAGAAGVGAAGAYYMRQQDGQNKQQASNAAASNATAPNAAAPQDTYDPSQDPMYQNLYPSLPTVGVQPTQSKSTQNKGQNAPRGRQAQRLEGMRALTQAVSQGAAGQPGAPAPTDTSVVPNTPSGRPDYKYYADMLNAADSNDSYYRDFLNLRNQARAAAREAAASNMRYQFVPIRDDRANRIYFVNADGSDVVLDMGKPEDVREYRRVAEKIGVDINHLSDWMDRSSKPLARYNMPPGSNVDTTPDFGFWRKLPSTKAEGAEPAMDTPSTPTNLGLSLGERNLPRSAKMPSPQSTLETMQRMRDLRMPLGGFPAAQTPEPATPAAPAPSAPVAQTKQAEPAKSAEEQGTKMQQPAVAAVAPQSQQFTPRAAAAPRPAGESTRMMEMRRGPRMGEMDPSMPSETLERTETPTPLEWQRMLPLVKTRKSTYPRRDFVPDLYDGEEQLPDWLSNLSVAQNVIGESIFKGLRKDSMYKDIPVSKPNVRHLESDLPAEPPLPPVEQGQVGAPVVLTPSNMPRVNPEDEDMSRFRQYRNFIPH